MKIEVSNGEIIDKLIIIQIKLEQIKDEAKLKNLKTEYDILKTAASSIIDTNHPLVQDLYQVNLSLWHIEDKIREHEKAEDFGNDFIELARSVYKKNDQRFELKRKINIQTSSHLTEEKSYGSFNK